MHACINNTLGMQVVIAFFAFVQLAAADVTGTIEGRVLIRDNRASSPDPASLGTLLPASHMVVAVSASSSSSHINPNFFAVTGNDGRFTLQWTDETRTEFPVMLHVKVTYVSSEGAGGGRTAPPVLFQILRSPNINPEDVFNRNVTSATINLGDLSVDGARADQESAAYLTTREFFDRIVAKSRNLRERMPGLVVKTRVPGFGMFAGLTPVAHEVWVENGASIMAPLTLAHEVGHAITWAALQLNSAPINPLSDYMMNGVPGWAPDSREFSKAAFLEGMADFWSLVWMFGRNDDPIFVVGSKTFRVETGRVVDSSGSLIFRCRTVDRPWEFPFCHTAALWDLFDSDDNIELSIAQFIDTLNHFPNNCISNGCRDELGFDALNHLDFLRNAPAALQARILAIWQANGISGGI